MKAKAAIAGAEDEKFEAIEVEHAQPEVSNSPSVEEIRQRAYELHVERGGVHGWDQEDWLQAERDLAQK